jgi:hypothetical protein
MRGDLQEQVTYFKHLFELVSMRFEWKNPHRIPVELYLAGKKPKTEVRDRLVRF